MFEIISSAGNDSEVFVCNLLFVVNAWCSEFNVHHSLFTIIMLLPIAFNQRNLHPALCVLRCVTLIA
jgi:hypothetical protein